jgi:hypothetical protein
MLPSMLPRSRAHIAANGQSFVMQSPMAAISHGAAAVAVTGASAKATLRKKSVSIRMAQQFNASALGLTSGFASALRRIAEARRAPFAEKTKSAKGPGARSGVHAGATCVACGDREPHCALEARAEAATHFRCGYVALYVQSSTTWVW